MELALLNDDGSAAGQGVEVSEQTFGAGFNEALVHQAVVAYMAGARSGTRAHKSRSDVRGGGAKPWRQKGTGRARVGTIRSPLWRGGGRTFAARPVDHSQKINRKMYRGALRAILSELVRQERLVVVESFKVEGPKTKVLSERLGKMGLNDVLVITDEHDEALVLSARNLHWVDVLDITEVNPVSLIAFDKVVVTVPALKKLEERLA